MRKNFLILTRTGKKKSEDCIDIANKRIDEKSSNLLGNEEEN